MADYIDKFKTLSGSTLTEFDINATSGTNHAYYVDKTTTAVSANAAKTATVVGSAKGINSTYKISLGGDIAGDDLVGTAISANKTINTRITNVPWKAISATDASGAKSNITTGATTWSSTNERFLTPDVTYNYVSAQTSGIAEAAGLYQVKGNSTTGDLTAADKHHIGYVYNVTNTGVIPTASGYNKQTFEVKVGDNVVWLTGGTQAGWDKLANVLEGAESTLKPYSAASATMNNFDSMVATVNTNKTGTTWNNTAYNLFKQVNTPNGNITAAAYNSTLTLSGLDHITAGGTSPTATFGVSNVSAYKTFNVSSSPNSITASLDAGAWGDQFTFAAGSAITLTPTVDTNGNPIITINKTNTTYSKATSSSLGMVQKSYYKETDSTNHIGQLIVQGNMSSTTFTGSDLP
jgi:hypothetical protein